MIDCNNARWKPENKSSIDFLKNTQIWNFVEIRPVEAEFSCADRQADGLDETDNGFLQFRDSAIILNFKRKPITSFLKVCDNLELCP